MTDGPDKPKLGNDLRPESRLESLASQAIAMVASRRAAARTILSERMIIDLVEAVTGVDDMRVAEVADAMIAAGIRPDDIQDLYIPEAARRLGTAWVEDSLGFAEVSIGTARLQRMLHDVPERPRHPSSGRYAGLTVLVIVPGNETHTLGARVLATQLRRMGASVRLSMGESDAAVAELVANRRFDAVFISIAVSNLLANVRGLVEKIKRSSGSDVRISVGGPATMHGVDLLGLTGADVVTNDPEEALRRCVRTTLHQGASSRVPSE